MTMTNGADTITITIWKRAWWFWALAALWVLVEVLLLQTASASMRESEYRAADIAWILAALVAGAGVVAWLRPGRPHRPRGVSEPL
jgi:hypothetical protein